MDTITRDYFATKAIAIKWARIAIDARRNGQSWHLAARNAHEALSFALLIIR